MAECFVAMVADNTAGLQRACVVHGVYVAPGSSFCHRYGEPAVPVQAEPEPAVSECAEVGL